MKANDQTYAKDIIRNKIASKNYEVVSYFADHQYDYSDYHSDYADYDY